MFAREINLLSDVDRNKRRRSLERIQSMLDENNEMNDSDLQPLIRNVLKRLEDKVEKCRELSVDILHSLVPKLSLEGFDWLLNVIVSRLVTSTTPSPNEESEEIRLKLVELSLDLMKHFSIDIGPQRYAELFVGIMIACIKDPYPAVKRKALQGVVCICNFCPESMKEYLYQLAKTTKLHALLHKHSSIRQEAIGALNALCAVDTNFFSEEAKNEAGSQTIMQILYHLTLDGNETVRLALIDLSTLCLTEIRTRREQHKRFIPIVLLLCNDLLSSVVRKRAHDTLATIGHLYNLDNEDHRSDFSKRRLTTKDIEMYAENPCSFPLESLRNLLDNQCIQEPSLGTQLVVADAFRDFLSPFLTNLLNSVDPNGLKIGTCCLLMTCLYSGPYLLEYLQKLLEILIKLQNEIKDDIPEYKLICKNINMTSLILGIFLPTSSYVDLLLPNNFQSLPLSHHSAIFSTLRSMIEGSLMGKHRMNVNSAQTITRNITNDVILDSIINASNMPTMKSFVQLLETVLVAFQQGESILADIEKGIKMPNEVLHDPKKLTLDFALMWAALLLLQSPHAGLIQNDVLSFIEKISKIITASPRGIYHIHLERILHNKANSMRIPSEIVEQVQKNLSDPTSEESEMLLDLYIRELSDIKFSVNVNIQVQYFIVFSQFLHPDSGFIMKISLNSITNLLLKIILPQTKFHPGNSALIFRRISCNCLTWVLKSRRLQSLPPDFNEHDLLDKIIKAWISFTEADEIEVRLLSIQCLVEIWMLPFWTSKDSIIIVHSLIDSVMSRLDDNSDEIREYLLVQMRDCFRDLTQESNLVAYFFKDFTKRIQMLITHMDDMNPRIRDATQSLLTLLKVHQYDVVRTELLAVREKHKFQEHIDAILVD